MDSSKSPKHSNFSEVAQDRISDLPSIVTDKILKRLPLAMAAKMGLVSTKWRAKWLSYRHLVLDDKTIWYRQDGEAKSVERVVERLNRIIVNILLHHIGPLHKFYLDTQDYTQVIIPYLSQWLSFLSRTSVKKITLINRDTYDFDDDPEPVVPSHIFACEELVKLRLECFALNRPPSGFKGFAYLQSLEFDGIEFNHDILGSLITGCPRLTVLKLERCISVMNHLVVDATAPSLKILVIIDSLPAFESLHFKSVEHLNRITLRLEPTKKTQALRDTVFKLLSTACQNQYLQLGRNTCKLLAAGSVTNSLPQAFKHLKELCLMLVALDDLNVFSFILRLIQICPCIRDLEISVFANKNAPRHKIELNESCKLDHLTKMKITGITGSSAELQFLEYIALYFSSARNFIIQVCTTLLFRIKSVKRSVASSESFSKGTTCLSGSIEDPIRMASCVSFSIQSLHLRMAGISLEIEVKTKLEVNPIVLL